MQTNDQSEPRAIRIPRVNQPVKKRRRIHIQNFSLIGGIGLIGTIIAILTFVV